MSLPLFVSFIISEPMQRRQLAQLVNLGGGREGDGWGGGAKKESQIERGQRD